MNTELHVIFGAGQVGYPLAQELIGAGKRVRVAKRSPGGTPSLAEVVNGDATDAKFCLAAARGATAVYHCMNPPYDSRVWAEQLPRMMDGLIHAAGAAGARLVALDNVYSLGKPDGKVLDEDSPDNPCSPLGEVRARVSRALFKAHERGDVRAVVGRASDFYGPRGTLTHLGDHFWPSALRRGVARVLVDPDALHTYHYIPDVARGLAVLGTADADAYGRQWMLPCRPAESMRALVARFSDRLAFELRLRQLPRWGLKLAALSSAQLREVDRMLYQWEEPFVINDQRFRKRFDERPTDAEQAAADTVTWARCHYTLAAE